MTYALPIAIALLAATLSPVAANDDGFAGLPGVKRPDPIVTPADPRGEPETSDEAETDRRAYRVGDWDIRIGGEISLQLGTTTRRRGD